MFDLYFTAKALAILTPWAFNTPPTGVAVRLYSPVICMFTVLFSYSNIKISLSNKSKLLQRAVVSISLLSEVIPARITGPKVELLFKSLVVL